MLKWVLNGEVVFTVARLTPDDLIRAKLLGAIDVPKPAGAAGRVGIQPFPYANPAVRRNTLTEMGFGAWGRQVADEQSRAATAKWHRFSNLLLPGGK